MADSLYYTYIVNKPTSEAFFVPDGFESNVEVHLWGAGGGGGLASSGGGGGYVKSIVTVAEGDFFEITVGGAGGTGSKNVGGVGGQGAGLSTISYAYGFGGGAGGTGIAYPGGDDQYYGSGGGGGGANVVIVNGVAVAVAAGGGGGGGGENYQAGYPGLPGGVAGTYTTTSSGGIGAAGYGAGGGGGGGYFGGIGGGAVGDDAGGGGAGYGGQSFGNISIPGSGTTAGGRATIYAPTSPPYGNAGYDGYAVLIFKHKFKIYNKINNGNVQINFSGNISASIGNYITQTSSGANAIVIAGTNTGNTLSLSYLNANVFTLTSGNITASPWTGNARVNTVDANVYPISTAALGTWTSVDKVWYKTPVAGTLSNVTSRTFSTVGDNLFVVPVLVKNLTINYPTPTGIVTTLFPVTAGETVRIRIGDFGENTTFTGLSGTLTLPAYDKLVFTYAGNVDHIIAQDVQVVTATPTTYSGSGSNGTITAGAAAAGITYNVTYEGWHGDLGATISITPALQSTIFQPVQVYVKTGGGRQFPSAHTYQQQPTSANGYIMNDYQGDYYGGEGGYSWETWMYQQGYVSISYDQAYSPGTWIPISQVYYKDSIWKPLINRVDIKTLVAKTLIYKGLTTETFTIPAGTTKVYARLIGGGGGGGGQYSNNNGIRGLPGEIVQGAITVTPGDVLTVSVGGGGGGGEDYVPPAPSGGGGGCKIICTKLHELGYLPDNIYAADELFGQWLRENDPHAYYGYVKWASVVVDWMESDGPQCMFWIRDKDKRGQAQRELAIKWARRIATPWAEHMAYKMGVGETDNRAGRMIMNTGMWISRLIGKYTKTTEPSKSVALGYVMWATFGVFWLLAGIK